MNAVDDMIAFGRRCALLALREESADHLASGLRAAALVPLDSRELRAALGLLSFASGQIGADHKRLFTFAAGDAEPEVRAVIEQLARHPLGAVELRWFCGEMVFQTPSGPGFIGRGFQPYRPTVPLDAMALELAGAVGSDYAVEGIELAKSLPAKWISDETVLAAATITAIHLGEDSRLSIFIAELSNPPASLFDEPSAVRIADGSLIAIIAGEEPIETAVTLARFAEPVAAILRNTRT